MLTYITSLSQMLIPHPPPYDVPPHSYMEIYSEVINARFLNVHPKTPPVMPYVVCQCLFKDPAKENKQATSCRSLRSLSLHITRMWAREWKVVWKGVYIPPTLELSFRRLNKLSWKWIAIPFVTETYQSDIPQWFSSIPLPHIRTPNFSPWQTFNILLPI